MKKGSKKMSLELKVNTSFKHSMDFMKDKLISNLNEANGKSFKVSEKDFKTICNMIILSFDQCSPGVFNQAESLIKDLKKNNNAA